MDSLCLCESSHKPSASRYDFVYEWWNKHQIFFNELPNSIVLDEEVDQNEVAPALELYEEASLSYSNYGLNEYGATLAQFGEEPLPYCYGGCEYGAAFAEYGTPLPFCYGPMMEYYDPTPSEHACVMSHYDPGPLPYYEPPRANSI
ncbi:hypothetical protein SFRURICE_002911 [Spodoptera frugiperda]|nr:hypothetical protein SFRURICE_002911 [Spodoptera frugiperda]